MTSNVIELRQVSKRYGDFTAVDNLTLSIASGQIFGLIGHNGAGKSTLFKMMLGLIPSSSGEILIEGERVSGARFREVRRMIGYLPENIVLYDNLNGLETLQFFARLKGANPASCPALLDKVGLTHAGTRRVRDYSKGMRQRLGFAQALLGNPRLLFLDEPTNGLDPEAIHHFYALVAELKAAGSTVILTSHILAEIQQRVDALALMQSGRLQATGTVAALSSAIQLPLEIHLTAAASARPALRAQLALAGFDDLRETPAALIVLCPSDKKRAALAVLTQLGEAVQDIAFREPSLEDVFLSHIRTASPLLATHQEAVCALN